jgi:outer membrane protein assembly factor BamB
MRLTCLVTLCAACLLPESQAAAQHRLILQGRDTLAIVDRAGEIEWEMPWGPIHDLQVLPNGHVLVQQGASKVVEIDPKTKQVVWSYDSATQNGNQGKTVEVHTFQPLGEGRLMIAESGVGRIIEIDRAGRLLKEFKLKIEHPHPHTDTRLARKLDNGHYLVCHEGDGTVREYDDAGKLAWEYEVPLFGRPPAPGHGPEAFGNKCFAAVRLANGNTLITTGNGHGVIEVTPEREIVWKIGQHDLTDITLAWVTTVEVLPDGHYLIGNCHAGADNPQVIELDPATKQVVWSFNQFTRFGNDVSNTLTRRVSAGRNAIRGQARRCVAKLVLVQMRSALRIYPHSWGI